MTSKRVLITGVAGHIGSKLAEWILENEPDTDVFGVDDLSCGYMENVPSGVIFTCADLQHAVPYSHGFDYVFHLAAYAAECLSPFVRAFNYSNNVVATARVVNHCLRYNTQRLVFTSSAAVYGRSALMVEGMSVEPMDPYGIAKLACEMDLRVAGEQHGLDYCILRPHNVYGPGQSLWQRYRNVFGIWFSQLFQGLPITVFGDGLQQRAFSYIDDVLPHFWKAAVMSDASRRTVNIGGTQTVTLKYVAEMFATTFGCGIEHLPARHEAPVVHPAPHLSEVLFGYEDHTPLSEGLEAMHAWALEAWSKYPQRRVAPKIGDGIEVARGLPESWARELLMKSY